MEGRLTTGREPRFSLKHELARYVAEEHRMNGNRTAVAAFLDDPSENPEKDYLSVNALELEGLSAIADYYRERFQGSRGDVAVCTPKVFDYSEAGKKAGVDVVYDRAESKWFFGGAKRHPAYKHQPLRKSTDLISESHCGVEFVRVLNAFNRAKFARRLGGRRYHLVKQKRATNR
jgi:hypothetical protein